MIVEIRISVSSTLLDLLLETTNRNKLAIAWYHETCDKRLGYEQYGTQDNDSLGREGRRQKRGGGERGL